MGLLDAEHTPLSLFLPTELLASALCRAVRTVRLSLARARC